MKMLNQNLGSSILKTALFSKKSILAIILAIFTFGVSNAQTTLASGDIALIGMDTPGEDFMFVTFVALSATTEIYFTDEEASGTFTIGTGEGTVLYTAPTGGITAGTVISYIGNSSDFTTTSDGLMALGNSGDGILAYQGTAVSSVTTFLHAIGEDAGDIGTFPGGFTNYMLIGADDGEYNGGRTGGTAASYLALINNNANWTTSGSGVIPFDLTFFTFGSTPTITTSTSSLTGYTYVEGSGPSAEQSFTVAGTNLTNDIVVTPPTNWEISTGTGGSFSATNPITLTQTSGTVATTTIYTRMTAGLLNVNSPFTGTDIACTSTGAATENIAVDGTVTLACATPTNQATALAFSNIAPSSIDVAWTASSPVSDNYLVVRSTSATLSSNPVDVNTYAVSASLGGGTVVFNGSGTSFSDSGLSFSTLYYYFVFAYNNVGCGGGPLYLTPALTDSETTLSAPNVVITEYAGSGLGGNFNNEYFELVNFDGTSVDLSGWTLEYYNNSALERTENLSGTIAANSAFVIAVRTTYTGALTPDYVPSSSFSMNSTGYVILKQGATIIDQAGSSANKFSDGRNYEFTDCPNDNFPTANWDDLGTGSGTPGVVNCACTAPATQATAAAFSNINPTTLDISWTAGSGTNSLVVITEGGAVSATPSSGTSYVVDLAYGSGDDIGTDEYVIYNGTGTSATVTGLTQGLTYHVAIYSFNSADDCYNIVGATVANETTSCGPVPDNAPNYIATCGNGETTLTWDDPAACFDNVLIFASENTCTSNTPTGNGGAYSPASTIFGSGDDDLETGVAYLVYKGTGNTVTITGLTNGQSYCFKIFSRQGTTWSSGLEVNCTPSITYCTAASTNDGFEYIQGVELNTINNTSAASTYTDFTSVSTTLDRGDTYPLTVYVGDFYSTDSCLVWIDWDYNGTFDNTELVFEGYGTAPFTGTITVPMTASLLTTRMRIRLYDDGAGTSNHTPCGTSTYGEVEDYHITVTEACVPVHTVTSYAPTSGPELTDVTIIGNSFTPITLVDFGGVSASVTYIDATTIIAQVPVGASTDDINITVADCDIQAGTFTVTEVDVPCFGTSSFTDVIFSEVYDSDAGNVAYIELYNPTGSDIDLDGGSTDYQIKIDNIPTVGINRTIDLTGTIVAGGTFLINLGTSSSSCGLTFDMTLGGSGFNADDYLYLEKNGTDVDRVNLPAETGFSVSRLGTASGPTTTYSAADWDIVLTESCAGLGMSPISPATPPTLTALADASTCTPNFSVTATAGATGTFTYVWYFNDGSAGWSVVNTTNLPNLTLAGQTTNSLTLSANTDEISTIDEYQFYVEVTEDGNCVANSNAAQYTDPENCIPCIQLFISEYGEPSTGDGKYIEIYNPTSNNVDLSNYEIWNVTNGGTWSEYNIGLSGLLAPFDVYVIANNATDVTTADQYHVNTMNFNGDDAIGLAYNGGSGGVFSLIDVVGEDGADPGTGWDVAGTTNATVNQTLRRKSTIQAPNTDWTTSAGTNTTNSEWEVLTYTLTSLNAHTGDCGTNSDAIVSFDTPPSITKDEDDPAFTIPVTIFNPDASATSVDIVLISGDASLLNSYTTQSVTFPGGSSADQTFTVTLTDDLICSGVLEYVFELQNVSGGSGAIIGANTTFTLTVIDDETGYDVILDDNFDDGDITDWIQTTSGEWEAYNGTSTPAFAAVLNGSHSMRQIADSAPTDLESFVYYNYDDCMPGVETSWRFQMYNNSNPSLDNYFYVYLTNDSETATQTTGSGYAIGVRPTIVGDHDFIELFKIVNGAVSSTIINTGIAWQSTAFGDPYLPNNKVGVEVTRDANGLWEVKLDTDGGFNNLVTYGTPATNTDFEFTERFGVYRKHTSSSFNTIMIDDVRIAQTSCSDTYYSQSTGNFDAAIWADQPVGTAQTITSGKFTRLVVQNGHTVTLNQDVVCDDITTESTGVIDAQDKHICVNGDFLNTGTFTEGTSSVNFNGKGTPAQILFSSSAISFYDITIDNPDGVTSTSEIDILNAIYPEEGTFNITAADLTLKSDATGTGSIAEIKSGASISGDITVERYIMADVGTDAFPGGWVGISTPVQGKTVANWNTDLITTGFPGSDYPTYAYPGGGPLFNNVIKWDAGSGAGGAWVGATALTDNISSTDGYFIYMQQAAQSTSLIGTFLQGSTTKALDDNGSGWNLVTNPYPCPVDWDLVYNAATSIGNIYYVLNSDTGVYISYTAGSSPNHIASSQSFWVRALSATSAINWSETQKVVDGTDVWERDEKATKGFNLVLNQNQMLDNCYIGFEEEATDYFDENFDSYKMNIPMPGNSSAFVYTTVEDIDLQHNIYGELVGEISIPVFVEVTSLEVEYSLSFEGMTLMEEYCLILEDAELGTFTPISEDLIYDFITEDNTDRFVIHISPSVQDCIESEVTDINELSPSASSMYVLNDELYLNVSSDLQSIDIDIINELGQVVMSKRENLFNGQGIVSLPELSKGIYIVRLKDQNKMILSEKIFR